MTQAQRFEKTVRRPNPIGPSTTEEVHRVTSALLPLDELTMALDRKWGAGRLMRLCRDNARLGIKRGWEMFHAAYDAGHTAAVVDLISRLHKTLTIADRQAEADGHQPLSPEVWETRMDDGRVLRLTRTNAEAVAAQLEDRECVALHIDEIARLWPHFEMLGAIKQEFPGARIDAPRTRPEGFAQDWVRGDLFYHGEEEASP